MSVPNTCTCLSRLSCSSHSVTTFLNLAVRPNQPMRDIRMPMSMRMFMQDICLPAISRNMSLQATIHKKIAQIPQLILGHSPFNYQKGSKKHYQNSNFSIPWVFPLPQHLYIKVGDPSLNLHLSHKLLNFIEFWCP